MSEDSSTQKVDPGLVAEIVSSHVSNNSIAIDQIRPLIATVHRILSSLGTNAPASPATEEKLTSAVPIRRSVKHAYVVCLECGFRGATLRRHLRVRHGLEVVAYRTRARTSQITIGLVTQPLSGRASSSTSGLNWHNRPKRSESHHGAKHIRDRWLSLMDGL